MRLCKVWLFPSKHISNFYFAIKRATNPKKKVDVFKGSKLVASIGDTAYSDYPTYLKSHGSSYAEERRRLYHIRHNKDSTVQGSPGYYALRLLW